MSAPSFVQASTGTADSTGAWTHTAAAPAAAGNLYIVQVLQDGTATGANQPTISSVTNAENLAGTDNVLTFIGAFGMGVAATSAYQHLWIGRATSTSAMVITGANAGGDDVYVRVYEFTDVNTGTTIQDVYENNGAGFTLNGNGSSNEVADAGVITSGPDRLALNFVAVNDDNAISAFTGETGGDWTLAVAPYADSGGTDGAIGLQAAYPVGSTLALDYTASSGVFSLINGGTGTIEQRAQSFVAPASGVVPAVRLFLRKTISPTGTMSVEIQTDSAGVPSGTVVGTTATLAESSLDAAPGGTRDFIVSALVTPSSTYWIVVRRSARDTTNTVDWARSSGSYASGEAAFRSSGAWTAAQPDQAFGILTDDAATIDGGTGSIVDIDAWGVVGFALIGTTVVSTEPARPEKIYLQAVNRSNVY